MARFQDRIYERYDELTAGFRKLADFLLNNTLDAAFLTVAGVSRRTGVDPATVVRFAQEFGYSGYRELSLEIKDYVRQKIKATYSVPEDGTDEAIVASVFEAARFNLDQFAATEMARMVKAVQMLVEAKRLWVTGEHTSYSLARFLTEAFDGAGLPSFSFRPTLAESADALSKMAEGDVLIGIALGTPSLDVGYAVKEAKALGVKTIVISESGSILPIREADVPLIVPSRSPTTLGSFAPSLTVMMLLWESYLAKKPQELADKFTSLYDYLGQLVNLRMETETFDL